MPDQEKDVFRPRFSRPLGASIRGLIKSRK
jgi:hypothetical protein